MKHMKDMKNIGNIESKILQYTACIRTMPNIMHTLENIQSTAYIRKYTIYCVHL